MSPRLAKLALFVGTLMAFLPVAVPMYFIRPFRAQETTSLLFSLRLRELAPAISITGLVIVLTAILALWFAGSRSIWKGLGFGLALAFAGFFAYAARVNVFEMMFHPMKDVRFTPASAAKLDPGEMVLAVRIGGEARAYPVTYLAYHHIANDTVGGVPIAATY